MTLTNKKASETTKNTVKTSVSKESRQVKRTSIKNGRHVNPRSLSRRVMPLLPIDPKELLSFALRYFNRSQNIFILLMLKEYRRRGKNFPLTREFIAERMGEYEGTTYGLDMISDYSNKTEDFGIIYKMYRCDSGGKWTNLYRVNPVFENKDYLDSFIRMLELALRENKVARKIMGVFKSVINTVNSALISICKRGFGSLIKQKSTHTRSSFSKENHRKKSSSTGNSVTESDLKSNCDPGGSEHTPAQDQKGLEPYGSSQNSLFNKTTAKGKAERGVPPRSVNVPWKAQRLSEDPMKWYVQGSIVSVCHLDS